MTGLEPRRAGVVIVGGGPAGMMAGLLFTRAGVPAVVLEKHADFLRDFRGDTVHPSTIDLMDELGLLDRFLALPHDRVGDVGAVIGGKAYRVADFSHLPGPGRFVAMMPQWHFLDFLAGEARRHPDFTLRVQTDGAALIEESGRIVGVRERTRAGIPGRFERRGKQGFVAPGTLLSPYAERLCYARDITGRWRIAGFVGGGD